MKTILIIDDDQDLTNRLKQYFAQFELELLCAHLPSAGLEILAERPVDALLLDVMLPEKDGFTLCREVRAKSDIPILMLTARGELTDRVLGLEIGADDYLPKPFEPRELVARIEVLLRRNKVTQPLEHNLHFDGLTIDIEQHQVTLDNEIINLTGMEFRLLHLLSKNAGRVYNRDEILNELRGIDADVYSRSIDILLSRLRQKLNDDVNAPKYIKTLRNVGYCFVGKKLDKRASL